MMQRKFLRKLVLGFGLAIPLAVAQSTILTHDHPCCTTQLDIEETNIPSSGNWRCKIQVCDEGEAFCAFEINFGMSGSASGEDGFVGCGQTVYVTTDYTFKSGSLCTEGDSKAWGWTNEAAPPYCPAGGGS